MIGRITFASPIRRRIAERWARPVPAPRAPSSEKLPVLVQGRSPVGDGARHPVLASLGSGRFSQRR